MIQESNYISFWKKIIKPEKFGPIKSIDWNKPWKSLFTLYPLAYGLMLFRSISNSLTDTITPYIIIVFAVEKPKFTFIATVLILLYTRLMNWSTGRYNMYLYDLLRRSIHTSFNREILTKDPIYFSTQSTGETISISERGANAAVYITTSLMQVWVKFLVPPVIALITLGLIHWSLSVASLVLMVFVGYSSSYFTLKNNKHFLSKSNKAENNTSQTVIENLTQTQLIRSVFETENQINKHKKFSIEASRWSLMKWRVWQHITDLQLTVMLIIGAGIFWTGFTNGWYEITPLFAAGMVNLIGVYNGYWQIGLDVRDFLEAKHNSEEMFNYIKKFGKQSYPVIENSK